MYDTQLCNDAYTTVQNVIAHLMLIKVLIYEGELFPRNYIFQDKYKIICIFLVPFLIFYYFCNILSHAESPYGLGWVR